MGRDGPTPWLPRTLDNVPLDFFFWGYVKDRVFATLVKDVETFKVRITDAVSSVKSQILGNRWREMKYHFDILRVTKDDRIEIY